jgi:hypothetical protein
MLADRGMYRRHEACKASYMANLLLGAFIPVVDATDNVPSTRGIHLGDGTEELGKPGRKAGE